MLVALVSQVPHCSVNSVAMPVRGEALVSVLHRVPEISGRFFLNSGVSHSADTVSSLERLDGHNVGREIDIFEECDAQEASV